MRITKLFSQMIYCGAFSSISVFTFAQEPLTHDHLREHGGQIYLNRTGFVGESIF